MKKITALCLAGLVAVATMQTAAARDAGGISGGLVGCCFGIRTAAAWNEGKNLELREWIRIIPFVGIVGAIWNGVDGWNGVTTADLRKTAGEQYY